MWCDHLDAVALGQVTIQTVTVIGSVADQSCREGIEEAASEDAFNEPAFVRRSAFDTNGERKTVIIGKRDDSCSLAAPGGPDREAPFLPVKEASMKASSSCNFPRACNSSASPHQDVFQLALSHPLNRPHPPHSPRVTNPSEARM
jgi:hypothetical protein